MPPSCQRLAFGLCSIVVSTSRCGRDDAGSIPATGNSFTRKSEILLFSTVGLCGSGIFVSSAVECVRKRKKKRIKRKKSVHSSICPSTFSLIVLRKLGQLITNRSFIQQTRGLGVGLEGEAAVLLVGHSEVGGVDLEVGIDFLDPAMLIDHSLPRLSNKDLTSRESAASSARRRSEGPTPSGAGRRPSSPPPPSAPPPTGRTPEAAVASASCSLRGRTSKGGTKEDRVLSARRANKERRNEDCLAFRS